LHFTPTEFRLLWELARQPGYVLSRTELTKLCKGSETAVQARTIDAHIKSIRRKLNDHADLIETVHGVGYRLQEVPSVIADRTPM
jgi:two-component system phosphate regulon response regulator PhoB